MTERDSYELVRFLGLRLAREQGQGWRDKKALVHLVALHGDWAAASALADALDLDEKSQEGIFLETQKLIRERP